MILAILVFAILAILILQSFAPPEAPWRRFLLPFSPVLFVLILIAPFPLPELFLIHWSPDSLFPESLLFRATPDAIWFSVCLFALLLLFEWTRLFHRPASVFSRSILYIFAAAGCVAFFASNALSVFLAWSLLDILSVFSILALERISNPAPGSVSKLSERAAIVLSLNFCANALILYAALVGPQSNRLEWSSVWSNPPTEFALAFFIIGITLRLSVFPYYLNLSEINTSSSGVDAFLRIVPLAAIFSLLAKAWPGEYLLPGSPPLRYIPLFLSSFFLFVAGLQWWASAHPLKQRENYFLIITCISILAALQIPQASSIFQLSGSLVLLGGGIVMSYSGRRPSHRWTVVWLLLVIPMFAGIPFLPGHHILGILYSGLLEDGLWWLLIPVFFGLVFSCAALIHSALSDSSEPPVTDRLAWVLHSLLMVILLLLLLSSATVGSISFQPVVLLSSILVCGSGVVVFLLGNRFRAAGESLLLRLDPSIYLRCLSSRISRVFSSLGSIFLSVESILSGEGAILWSLGFIILAWLVWRGI